MDNTIRSKNLWVICLLALASSFIIIGGQNLPSVAKKNCTYAITIETTCTKGADTSGHISLRFGDSNSNDIIVRHLNTKHMTQLDPLYPNKLYNNSPAVQPFQACTVDQFQVTNKCIKSPICYLYLKLAGNDDWRPGYAQVRLVEDPNLSSEFYYFRRYLPRRVWHGSDSCDREITPFGVKYKRKVFMKGSKKIDKAMLLP